MPTPLPTFECTALDRSLLIAAHDIGDALSIAYEHDNSSWWSVRHINIGTIAERWRAKHPLQPDGSEVLPIDEIGDAMRAYANTLDDILAWEPLAPGVIEMSPTGLRVLDA